MDSRFPLLTSGFMAESPLEDPRTLEALIDGVIRRTHERPLPPIIYHYTSVKTLGEILNSQRWRATAYDCTNDPGELISAHEFVLEAADQLRGRYTADLVLGTLDLFVRQYPLWTVERMVPVYLSCFSAAGDDPGQWQSYGDSCRGVSIGLRTQRDDGPPANPGVARVLLEVTYAEAVTRGRLLAAFDAVCQLLVGGSGSKELVAQGASGLFRIAALEAVGAKTSVWLPEREVRLVTVAEQARPPELQIGAKRCVDLPLRSLGRRIEIAELIIGPEAPSDTMPTVVKLLERAGYTPGDPEYPRLIVSSAVCWGATRRRARPPSSVLPREFRRTNWLAARVALTRQGTLAARPVTAASP
jgi:hypothetical protein